MLSDALSTALQRRGWIVNPPESTTARYVVLVEDDEGRTFLPSVPPWAMVRVALGSIRTLDALLPLVRRGAVALNAAVPFAPLSHAVSWVLDDPRAPTSAQIAASVAALRRRQREVSLVARLTPSERNVLVSLAEGQTAVAIARRTGRSEHTVRSQIRSVLRKLEVGSQLVAVAIARRSGLAEYTAESLRFTNFGDASTPAGGPR